MRNQKGVSLITLVITIIVVIILAAIALGGGAADTASQAQFSGFATEMGGLQESVRTAMDTAKGEEAIRGNNRANSQLYNFVARGGSNVLSGDSGDSMWLTQADANAIPCTLIQKTYAEDVFGANLPSRKVETYYGTNQEVSYYVTPKGKVFCWPPYPYDDKSYVTNNVTVKTKSGDGKLYEIPETEATMAGEYTIYFEDTKEYVGVEVTDSSVSPTTALKNLTAVKGKKVSAANDAYGVTATIGVWYGQDDATVKSDVHGVAKGIDYKSYNNTDTVAGS